MAGRSCWQAPDHNATETMIEGACHLGVLAFRVRGVGLGSCVSQLCVCSVHCMQARDASSTGIRPDAPAGAAAVLVLGLLHCLPRTHLQCTLTPWVHTHSHACTVSGLQGGDAPTTATHHAAVCSLRPLSPPLPGSAHFLTSFNLPSLPLLPQPHPHPHAPPNRRPCKS